MLRTDQATVRVDGLSKAFGERAVLHELSLNVRPGEFVALLGRSGSGKSTLLRILAGLDADAVGEYTVDGTVSMAFQDPRLLPWRRVWRNITLGLDTDDPRGVAKRALTEVRLAEKWTLGHAPCPAGRPSGFRWRGRWFVNRGCCCWTNRSARWTR